MLKTWPENLPVTFFTMLDLNMYLGLSGRISTFKKSTPCCLCSCKIMADNKSTKNNYQNGRDYTHFLNLLSCKWGIEVSWSTEVPQAWPRELGLTTAREVYACIAW